MKLFKPKPKTEREKVEERREEVLAQGRKFKYPMQYAKHKLIINTLIVALVAIALMIGAGWAMLYKMQDTGDMIYRITQVIPVPVAEVAGEKVRYSDYLMIYRSNLITAEQQGGQLGDSSDEDYLRAMYKQAALDAAIDYTYALKLGKELGISVTNAEIDEAFNSHRIVGGVERSEESFLKIIKNNFGMNRTEYRRMLYLSLMKAKVVAEIDSKAKETVAQVERILAENDNNYLKVTEELGEAVEYQETGQLVDNMNVDGGRSDMAMTLEPGQSSGKFLSSSGDGYYFVKLNEKTETEVNYASLKVMFTEFDLRLLELYEDGEVEEYIKLDVAEDAERAAESTEDGGGR